MAEGYVYFGGYGSSIKIGKSIKPRVRIANLNTANPNNVKLYAVVATADMGTLEKKMHKWFEDARKPGKREWYYLTAELQYLCNQLAILENPTELDIGITLGTFQSYAAAQTQYINRIASLNRSLELANHRQREHWAQHYALKSMKFWQYPLFQRRYDEAMAYMATLPSGDAPVFITDKDGNLAITSDESGDKAA